MNGRKRSSHRFVILCCFSFAGKSTLGKALREQFGYEEVDVDVTKVRLHGPGIRDEDLRPEDWVRIYTETDRQILELLQAGQSVVDASRNFSRSERAAARSLSDQAHVPLITIYVDTSEEVARRRWLDNKAHPSRRDVSAPDFEDAVRAMQPPGEDESAIVFNYGDEIQNWLLKNSALFA